MVAPGFSATATCTASSLVATAGPEAGATFRLALHFRFVVAIVHFVASDFTAGVGVGAAAAVCGAAAAVCGAAAAGC